MKKLYRSKNNKIIAGVCSGLGEYFDIDPTIVRILFCLAVVTNGVGLLFYIILWILVPFESQSQKEVEEVVKENAQEIKETVIKTAKDLKEVVHTDTEKK